MEDVVVVGSSDDDEGSGALGGGARAGSSSAGASAVSGGGVGGERTTAAKTKKPKAKKRASADGGARAAHPKAKKRAKATKGRVSASWTDSEDENADASSMRQPSIPWAAWIKKPPPTMGFSGNVAQEPPAYWALKKGGSEAANLRDSMENCRLIGSVDMAFECGDDAQMLAKLHAPVKSSWRNISPAAGARDVMVRFDKNGEPGSSDCYTVHRLLRGCDSGLLVPKDDAAISVLSALVDLARPDESARLPWTPQPLLRAVCPKAAAKQVGKVLKVRIWIYFRRLLFEMIAYPPLMTIMRAIDPVGEVRRTVALPPLESPTFVSHAPADMSSGPDYSFSLAGLMKAQEHCGYRKAQQPAGLRLQMKDYQLQTLAWMIDHEKLPHGLNQLFWEKRTFLDGGDYYYAPELGELRLEQPLERRGGILSEEMGLGKTIEILALILATKEKKEIAPVQIESAHEMQGSAVAADNIDGEGFLANVEEDEGWAGEWGTTAANDTPSTIAVKCCSAGNSAVSAAQIVNMNLEAFPSLTKRSKLKRGTRIRLRPSTEADEVSCRTRKRRASGEVEGLEEKARPCEDKHSVKIEAEEGSGSNHGKTDIARGGTLIVVPVHLVSQWLCEIEKAAGGSLSVRKYTAENKLNKRCTLHVAGPRECEGWLGGCPGPEGHLRLRIKELACSADIIVTTYAMLKDDKSTFNRIKWDRVVLDEMQEIRSSTTDHARACEKLLCDCRWMVSGTPLYTSIDDLNGELAFLGVLPFCASDSVDGFWNMRVSKPFSRRSTEALELLNRLLGGVMIRHSKSQSYLDGSSILELPTSSTRRIAIPQSDSEKYLYQFLEMNAASDLAAMVQGAGSFIRDATQNGMRANFWMRVLREASLAPSLINGGAGCTPQNLRDLDFRLRALGGGFNLGGGVGGDPMSAYDPNSIRSLVPGDALKFLMQCRDVAETARHHKNNHMIRHGNKEQGVYDRNRAYAMPTVLERLVEVGDQRQVLYDRVKVAARDVPLLRWRWALECITSGRYWDDVKPSSTFSLMFMRRAFAAIHLNQSYYLADQELQQRDPHDKHTVAFFQDLPFSDRAKLKQSLTSSLPTGMRVIRLKALEAYDPPTAEELAFKKDDVITVAATTRAGWNALGFSWKPNQRYAPKEFFEREASSFAKEDFLLLGCSSSIVATSESQESAQSGRDGTTFKVSGEIGIVHSRMVKVLGASMRTSKVDVPSGRVANLREEQRKTLQEMVGDAAESLTKIKDLDPYLKILQRAQAAGAGQSTEDTIQQSGFQQLYEIELGESPKCCVCQEGCGYAQRPTYMRCAHFACEDCIVRWVMYERSKNQHRSSNLGTLEATCPLCRKPFSLSDLIRIIKPAEDASAGCSSGSSGKGKEPADQDLAASAQPETKQRSRGQVEWTAAATAASLGQISPPPGGILARNSIQGLANFPSFTPELGSHLVQCCGVGLAARAADACPQHFSTKVQRLLEDLESVAVKGEKAVVFSQHKQGVLHLSRVFSEPRVNIGHVKIVGGDSQSSQEQAVKQFNEQDSIKVFLLHAGQAAAGLTLTRASHVFLMEPFMKAGEQAQAMNRCHRIGQTKDVTCTLYYAPDTIEERMEAWKDIDGADEVMVEGAGATDALSVLDHEKNNISESLAKVRFLLGISQSDESHSPAAGGGASGASGGSGGAAAAMGSSASYT